MREGGDVSFGTHEAEQLLNLGWRQCSAFRSPEQLQVPHGFRREDEWLVVCTQSCSVVSERLAPDPHVEVCVAKPVKKYNPRDPKATGKNARAFLLPFTGPAGSLTLECDINRRFFIPRQECLAFTPDWPSAANERASRAFAGWLARYYSRVALPNQLVVRARASGLFSNIETAIATAFKGEELRNFIDGVFVHWVPDQELEPPQPYTLAMFFLCDGEDAASQVGQLVAAVAERFEGVDGHGGIRLIWDAKSRTSTFVSELSAYHRLSDWDYLSDLGRLAEDNDMIPVGDG